MFVAHYGSSPDTRAKQKAKRTTATGRGHERKG
jgi:hypothetical protein